MKNTKTLITYASILFITLILIAPRIFAETNFLPEDNNGKKWRIGFYEGGQYIEYQNNFIALLKGLKKLGWLDFKDIPAQNGEQTTTLWKWLNSNEFKSDFVEFVPNAHYSSDWDKEKRKTLSSQIINRLTKNNDLDLMIAAGTWAGQDLATNKHTTPTIVISTSDPIASKIIKSAEDSGFEHIHARVDPFRYERQIRIFHDIIGFKTLGITYEDTLSGRSISAIDTAHKLAGELNFEVIECHTMDDIPDKKQSVENSKACFNELVKKVDAIYVTILTGVNHDSIHEFVNIFNINQVPTFSQYGSKFVDKGLLMSISRISFDYVGQFYAETIARILKGEKPGAISQIFEDPPKIAINIKTATIIGYDPPVDVLSAADEIFQEINQ